MCNLFIHYPASLIDEWIKEDIPFADLTTSILGLVKKQSRAKIITREPITVCGLQEAARVYEHLGASVKPIVAEGEQVEAGTTLMIAEGTAGSLHAAWRVAQSFIAIGSAIASYTRSLVKRAKQVNPNIIIAVARKAPPGLRHLYYHCVLCGGASLHRVGISDSFLAFPNHTRLLGGIHSLIEVIRERRDLIGERRVVVEVETIEEAIAAAKSGVIDEVQLDHMDPVELEKVVKIIKSINPNVRVAIGGGINADNIADYASTGVDVIVTSAPYWVKPANITTIIEPLNNAETM
ncbi:ModD protein [Pyrofollis japonicus]|uniref:ModD protein n=1 Tax=Pyrofollis japonicus TaxID=3060460 RepID=UPI00295AE77C|nr:ModD protein [Pyrofollis japonicus]BEP17146.1 ModD protein [Pyrofollis japonicus]